MYSPYEIPGFPADFQPHCSAYTTFNVQGQVNSTLDQLLIVGDAFAIGEGEPHLAPQMWPYDTSPPVWNLTVQLPANAEVKYRYVLYHYSTDGSYTFEHQNRTFQTGHCNSINSPYEVHDTLSASSNSSVFLPKRTTHRQPELALSKRQTPPADQPGSMTGLPNRELLYPPYNISNYWPWGNLSVQTLPTNLYHSNGLVEYDVHNLYGTMMSTASRTAMEARRPGKRPLIITRSTFAGAGKHVGHWFGDNISTWEDYRISIRQMVEFAAFFQLPMVGSDVCGFNGNTTVHLCSRWAMLGAFNPFYRNHDVQGSAPQEFYRWGNDSLVAQAARKAIGTRYRLLDYLYTAMYRQHCSGTPALMPLFFVYPEDEKTFGAQMQFFFGESILISPVLEDNTTTVTAYMPDDLFYDFWTWEPVQGKGEDMTFEDVGYTDLPMHIRGGSIIPMRMNSANTTTMLRKEGYQIIIAPDSDGKASGSLYVDDGESLVQEGVTDVEFRYEDGVFKMDGKFEYDVGVAIESIVVLGQRDKPDGGSSRVVFNAQSGAVQREVNVPLTKGIEMKVI